MNQAIITKEKKYISKKKYPFPEELHKCASKKFLKIQVYFIYYCILIILNKYNFN